MICDEQVPYLPKDQLQMETRCLLSEYFGEDIADIQPPIPIELILEFHLGLILEFHDLDSMCDVSGVHGALWIPTRTVGVDVSLDPIEHPDMLGRYRFTLAHEVGHWQLHREFFRFSDPNQQLLFPLDECLWRSSRRARIEWQADYFAAQLLMPCESVGRVRLSAKRFTRRGPHWRALIRYDRHILNHGGPRSDLLWFGR